MIARQERRWDGEREVCVDMSACTIDRLVLFSQDAGAEAGRCTSVRLPRLMLKWQQRGKAHCTIQVSTSSTRLTTTHIPRMIVQSKYICAANRAVALFLLVSYLFSVQDISSLDFLFCAWLILTIETQLAHLLLSSADNFGAIESASVGILCQHLPPLGQGRQTNR